MSGGLLPLKSQSAEPTAGGPSAKQSETKRSTTATQTLLHIYLYRAKTGTTGAHFDSTKTRQNMTVLHVSSNRLTSNKCCLQKYVPHLNLLHAMVHRLSCGASHIASVCLTSPPGAPRKRRKVWSHRGVAEVRVLNVRLLARGKEATNGAPVLTTRSKDATRSKGHCY